MYYTNVTRTYSYCGYKTNSTRRKQFAVQHAPVTCADGFVTVAMRVTNWIREREISRVFVKETNNNGGTQQYRSNMQHQSGMSHRALCQFPGLCTYQSSQTCFSSSELNQLCRHLILNLIPTSCESFMKPLFITTNA